MMKQIISVITLFMGLCTMMGCGPSKAEIEAQRRADSARIVDSVRAVERMRIDDSLRIVERMRLAEQSRIADSIREVNTRVVESMMKKIAQTFNNSGREWKSGTDAIISKYATTSLKSTYAKYSKFDYSDGTGCYLLHGEYSDGYTTLIGKSVDYNSDTSYDVIYGVCYNGPGGEFDEFDRATFTLVLENGKWLIDDIEEDRFNSSFMENPQGYRGLVP